MPVYILGPCVALESPSSRCSNSLKYQLSQCATNVFGWERLVILICTELFKKHSR